MIYPSKKMLFCGVSYGAMMMTWMQRYAAAIVADGIKQRGKRR